MKLKQLAYLFPLLFLTLFCNTQNTNVSDTESILTYITDAKNLQFFYKDKNGEPFLNHGNLKKKLADKDQELVFAMNGGMYKKDFTPQGLYIENGKTIVSLDTMQKGYGNFYLQPNGVFYISKGGQPSIVTTKQFLSNNAITYATQSGPMLLIDGGIHPKFRAGSSNLHIRNGVGILPNGRLLFAMSKERINFYEFASFFKKHGCKNALYLDGFVSRTYLPSKNWEQLDGQFGIIIAEIDN